MISTWRSREKAAPELWGPEQGKWLARLDLERENFLSAHAWCDHARDGGVRGLRLVYALQLYWLPRGLMELGYRVTIEALARAGAQTRDLHRSGTQYAAGQLAFFMGAYPESKRHTEECLAIAHEFGIKPREAAAHLMLGLRVRGARRKHRGARAFRKIGGARARAGRQRASVIRAQWRWQASITKRTISTAAVPLFEEALALTRELDDQESISIHLTNLARALVDRGTGERVRALLQEGLAIARAIGSTRGEGYVVEVTASLAVLEHKWAAAARFYGSVQARFKEIGLKRTPADDAFLDLQMAKARQALGAEAFTTAAAAGRAVPWDDMLTEARTWLEA